MSDKEKKNVSEKSITPIGKKVLRILIIALIFAVVIVGTFLVMDMCSHQTEKANEPNVVTITVLGDRIRLEDGTLTDYSGLESYLASINESGELGTVALITDTAQPADTVLYNKVVELLSKYGIVSETLPATVDEATKDER